MIELLLAFLVGAVIKLARQNVWVVLIAVALTLIFAAGYGIHHKAGLWLTIGYMVGAGTVLQIGYLVALVLCGLFDALRTRRQQPAPLPGPGPRWGRR